MGIQINLARAVLACAIGIGASLSPAHAAEPGTSRIINGTPVRKGANTYQVALLKAGTSNNYDAQFCGGTLVGRRWVVTAAHCVDGKSPRDIDVLTGTNMLDGSGVRHPVNTIRIHPKYASKTDPATDRDYLVFDVAVLRLGTPAEPELDTAQLITRKEERKFADAGDRVLVSGWGNTSTGGTAYPIQLMKVRVPVVSQKACNAPDAYQGIVTGQMLCAGLLAGGKDACQGDSGGPLVISRAEKGGRVWLLAGVVSWGWGCAQPDHYGVYARIADMRDWIVKQINAWPY